MNYHDIQAKKNALMPAFLQALNKRINKSVNKNSLEYLTGCMETYDDISKMAIPVTPENETEFIGQIIDIFEDFLSERNIQLNTDKNENTYAVIYGSNYDELNDKLKTMMNQWNIINSKGE